MTTKKHLDDDAHPAQRSQEPRPAHTTDYAGASIIHLAAFLRDNPSPILLCDADGAIVKANPAAQRLLKRYQISTAHLLPPNHVAILQFCLEGGEDPAVVRVVENRTFHLTYQSIAQFPLVSLYITEVTPRFVGLRR